MCQWNTRTENQIEIHKNIINNLFSDKLSLNCIKTTFSKHVGCHRDEKLLMLHARGPWAINVIN